MCVAGARVVAVTPIITGRALKGPSADMLRYLGHDVSALGVARIYGDFASRFVLDEADRDLKSSIEALGMRVLVTDTVMKTIEDKRRLARSVVSFASHL